MADTSATIIAASLSSEELEKSIDKLVGNVATATSLIRKDFDDTVSHIKKSLNSLGDIKINSGGSSDGGSSRRTSKQKEEESQIKATTQAYKEQNATLDQQAAAIRKANQVSVRTGDAGSVRNADTLQMMQTSLDIQKESLKDLVQRLREARQQYSSFVAMAAQGARTGDTGLYKFATEGVRQFENEVKSLIPQIRNTQSTIAGMESSIKQFGDVIAPQGHTIQNYVNSLQKTNPELALLNEQFKKGQSELQNQSASYGNATQSAHQYTEEIRRQAQAIRETQQWKEKGYAMVGDRVYYDPERSVAPAKNRLSLEEQILNTQKEEEVAAIRAANAQRQEAAEKAATEQEARKVLATEQQITAEQQKRSQPKTFASYDSLQESIAHVLGLQKQQVRLVDEETASYRNLDSALKQYRQAYNALTDSERKSDNGKMLIRRMQEISREIQKIQALSARPISLESIIGKSVGGARIGGLSEKTLDDIAYKMQRLASLRSGLNVETQQTEIRTVNAEYDRLKKKMDEVMQKNQSMITSNNALGRSWNYMKNRLAFYFTVGASTQFIKNLIEVRSQYEMNERALGILINSAERGTQIFNELSQMALVSPYTLIELSNAAKQLTAYDIAARDVVDTTRRLADMASAVGVPIERLTYAMGQIKAYGYLNSRDARMFANAGIPLVKQLSDYYTELEGKMVSTADVYDRMKKKAIDYNSVMSVITKMTDEGGKFFDFQAKMADTLKVRLANLTLAWNNMLNDMGRESQGVLTWGIGALRQLFLHWKQLDALIKDAAWILGIRTGLMLVAYAALKAGGALGITTRQMALSSVVGTKLAGVLGTLGRSIATIVKSPLTWWSLLALAAWDIFDAFMNADKATIEFNKSLRDSAKTTYEDLKKFAEQYKNVRDSLYTTQKTSIGNIYDPSTGKAAATAYANQTVGQDISASEAKKVWEAMREQIELSSHASDEYISKLLSIENVSERLRQGFQIIDNIQAVSAALKEVGDDGIKVAQGWSAWWNAYQLPDGLIGNIKEVANAEKELIENFGSIEAAKQRGSVLYSDYEKRELENFRKDLKITTDSILDFINLNGWSGDIGKIDEVFKQVTDKLATQGNLDPQTAFTLQREVEVARAKAAKEALEIRIADEKNALATASDEVSKQQIQKNLETLEQQKRDFDKFNGENRAYWNDFTKYIKERHISELTAAYNSMTDHGKKAMDFQSEEWQKRVHDWANRYEKSHNLATDSVFNRLRNWINDANTWSVFIKMTISTEDVKSVYKQLEEYDKAADDAWKTMQRLDKRISQLRKKGAKEVEGAETGVIDLSRVSADDKELTEALKERTQAQKDYNNAVEKGGESKKENAAASKAQKAAESELQKALKDELQLIDRVRSQYKKLTDAGANDGEALVMVTNQFANSLAHINNVLGKNGIPLFDISKFAGTDNPNALLDMLKLQLDSAKIAKNIKPEEIKELEVKYSEIVVDARAYNLTKITKGLNNELDRLKDEYELAVSLDADPELGNMFADWMGIDVNDLPRTASEYAERASKELNKYLKENKANVELPNLLNVTNDDLRAFEEMKVLTDAQLENVRKRVQQARELQKKEVSDQIKDWDKLLEKYAEYETKINKIQNDAVKERVTFAQQFGNQDQKNLAINLQTQILAATDPQVKQKLIGQLQELIMSIAGDDKTKLNIAVSINNKQVEELAKASFEQFQKSPEWILATGDLVGMTDKALGGLIDKLEEFKKSAKDLDSKQIKNLNNALKNLYKQRRQGNPFSALINAMSEAKNKALDLQPEIDKVSAEIERLESIKNKGNIAETADELEKLKNRLNELKKVQQEVSKLNTTEWVNSLKSSYDSIRTAIGLFDDLAKAISGAEESDLDKVFKVIDKAVSGAQTGSSFGTYGAIIGAVVGAASGIITEYKDVWNGQEKINDQLKESTEKVRILTTTYNKLQRAIDDAYGMEAIGYQKLTIMNKQAELAELERQLELEKSRSAKNRDLEKISELEDKVEEARYELKNATREIVQDLLGIGDAQDWADNFVSSMIDAFRKGEDYMEEYDTSFQKMVDNLIAKAIAGKLIGEKMEKWLSDIEQMQYKNADENPTVVAAKAEVERLQQGLDMLVGLSHDNVDVPSEELDRQKKALWEAQQKYEEAYKKASELSRTDVDSLRENVNNWRQGVKDDFEEYMELFGILYGSDKAKSELSALQQGIQGITEDTAGALEGYMNIVSQQVFLHSELLTQIRDVLVGGDGDIQLGVQAQMLLQLQQSYQVQMAIQGILEGWSTPSGMGVRVELIS